MIVKRDPPPRCVEHPRLAHLRDDEAHVVLGVLCLAIVIEGRVRKNQGLLYVNVVRALPWGAECKGGA